MKKLMAAILAGLMLITCAQAELVKFVGEECPLPVMEQIGAEPREISLSKAEIIGKADEDSLVVLYGENQIGYVSVAELRELLPTLDLDAFEIRPCTVTVRRGDYTTEDALYVQQLLADCGYLTGTVDGYYGKGTAAAVSAFQTEAGIPVTGEADLLTQALLEKMLNGDSAEIEIRFPVTYSVEDMFGAFCDKTDKNLEPFATSAWSLKYDEYEGSGEINGKNVIAQYAYDAIPIDRVSMTVSLNVRVEGGTSENAWLCPAMKVSIDGAFGVYARSMILKRGNNAVKLEAAKSARGVQAASIHEEASFELTEEAAQLLSNTDAGALNIRVSGCNRDFELSAADAEKTIAGFVETCRNAGLIG